VATKPKKTAARQYRPCYTLAAHCDIEGRLYSVSAVKDNKHGSFKLIARNLSRDEAETLLSALEPIADRLNL